MADFQYTDKLGKSRTDDQGKTVPTIRVLEISPDLSDEGLISCYLKEIPLSDTHTALSYTWGSEWPQYTILINGKLLKVRQNLFQFLNVAQKHHHSKPLWIDAISINQGSTEERNQQVSFMADIYAQAEHVLIWLGQDDQKVEEALRYSKPSLRNYFESKLDFRWPEDTTRPTLSSDARRNYLTRFAQSLGALFSLNYWERAWVVQEFRLSRSKSVLYGDIHVSYKDLSDCYAWLLHMKQKYPQELEDVFSGSPTNALLDDFYRSAVPSSKYNSLADCLKRFQKTKCTDFRDLVFAFRSLFERGDLFPVSYEWSKESFLLAVAIFSIEELFSEQVQSIRTDAGGFGPAGGFSDMRKIETHRLLLKTLKERIDASISISDESSPEPDWYELKHINKPVFNRLLNMDGKSGDASDSCFYITPPVQERHIWLDVVSVAPQGGAKNAVEIGKQIERYVQDKWYCIDSFKFPRVPDSTQRVYFLDSLRTMLVTSQDDPNLITSCYRFTGTIFISSYHRLDISKFAAVRISEIGHHPHTKNQEQIKLRFDNSRSATLAAALLLGTPVWIDTWMIVPRNKRRLEEKN